jgi:hypothetical protein
MLLEQYVLLSYDSGTMHILSQQFQNDGGMLL